MKPIAMQILNSSQKILLVEDDEINRRMLETVLTGEGMDVIAVSNCADALPYIHANSVGVLLTDYDFGGDKLSGISLIKLIQDQCRPISVFVMSGYPLSTTVLARLGVTQFFPKNDSLHILIAALRAAITPHN